MKRKMSNFIIFSLLLLLFGCTGEVVKEFPEKEIPEDISTELSVIVQADNSLVLKFKPVLDATGYKYQIDDGTEVAISDSNTSISSDNYYLVETGKVDSLSGKVSLFALYKGGGQTKTCTNF